MSAARLRVPAGRGSQIGLGRVHVLALPPEAGRIPREALLLRDRNGVLRAYLNRCRHLPIPLDGGSRRFLTADRKHLQCGTHGALYRLADGLCVDGPCRGSALLALELEQQGDELYVLLPA